MEERFFSIRCIRTMLRCYITTTSSLQCCLSSFFTAALFLPDKLLGLQLDCELKSPNWQSTLPISLINYSRSIATHVRDSSVTFSCLAIKTNSFTVSFRHRFQNFTKHLLTPTQNFNTLPLPVTYHYRGDSICLSVVFQPPFFF